MAVHSYLAHVRRVPYQFNRHQISGLVIVFITVYNLFHFLKERIVIISQFLQKVILFNCHGNSISEVRDPCLKHTLS